MRNSLVGFLTLMSILTLTSLAFSRGRNGQDDGTQLGVDVVAYVYARVPAQTLERSENEAARILRNAGVKVLWKTCDPAIMDVHSDPNCTQLPGPLVLAVRILPDLAMTQGVVNERTLAFSVGNLASVSYRRVSQEAAADGVPPSEILGPVIAHELGHLLLVSRAHSHSGIMRARWSSASFQCGLSGEFAFSPEEATAIRKELRRRIRRQDAVAGERTMASK
jgi:hypothetical protein